MTRPGGDEGIGVNPTRDKIDAALRALSNPDNFSGSLDALNEATRAIARDFRNEIERSRPSSTDPEAWRLRRITFKEHSKPAPVYDEYYLLEAPEALQASLGVNMVVVRHQKNEREEYDGVEIFETGYENPYSRDSRPRSLISTASPTENRLLESISQIYDAVQMHGIKAGDDLTVRREVEEKLSKGVVRDYVRSRSRLWLGKLKVSKDRYLLAQQEREEQALSIKRQRAQEVADERRREAEGRNFPEGLRIYARTRSEERDSERVGQVMRTLIDSVQTLMWRADGSGEVVPGELLVEQNRFLLERLIGSQRVVEWLESNPRPALVEIEEFLTSRFLSVAENGQVIVIRPETKPGRFEREGKIVDRGGGLRAIVDRDKQGNLVLRQGNSVFTGLSIALTSADSVVEAKLLGLDGTETGRTIVSKPILQAVLTEQVPGGGSEQTTIYRTGEGLVVVCPNGEAKCYPEDLSAAVNITRKPVIYLYPTKQTDVAVRLDYKGQLTNTYPRIDVDTWKVSASPDGTLRTNGKKYKYLFWDGVNDDVDWDWSEGFCVYRDNVDSFLEEKIEKLGLNFSEAQDFITYWAPMIKQNKWSLVSFQTEKYEELAKLEISPKPDSLIRLFMVFKKVEEETVIKPQKLKKLKRKGFAVVEWGGSNLDELQLRPQQFKNNGFSILNHRSAAVFV